MSGMSPAAHPLRAGPKGRPELMVLECEKLSAKNIHAIALLLREWVGATQRRVGCGLQIGDQTNQNPFHERIGLFA